MKSKIELIPTRDMTREDWLAYRHTGIGASEVGTILGLDDYMSSLELFHYKVGSARKFDVEIIATFMGREQEDLTATLWQYWDGDEESMIENFRAGKIMRRCRRVNAYARNPDYPWLYVSLDRRIVQYDQRGEGVLELKEIGGYEADKWAAGIPPKYVTQVQTQLLITEFTWGEMALKRDGRRFMVLPFDRSEPIMEHIKAATKDFWERVVAGKKIVNEIYAAQMNFNQQRVLELQAQLDQLEPSPDGSMAYSDYVSEKYNKPRYADRRGTEEERQWAEWHLQLKGQIKELTERKQRYENELKRAMADYQLLDFGTDGKVYWAASEGRPRTFRNKLDPARITNELPL